MLFPSFPIEHSHVLPIDLGTSVQGEGVELYEVGFSHVDHQGWVIRLAILWDR